MGACCEPESGNIQSTSSNRKKRSLSSKTSSGHLDSDWYRSYAGKVHTAIMNLHKAPKSYVNKLDRVYEDLIYQSQIIDTPNPEARLKLKSMLNNAPEKRPGPKNTPRKTI